MKNCEGRERRERILVAPSKTDFFKTAGVSSPNFGKRRPENQDFSGRPFKTGKDTYASEGNQTTLLVARAGTPTSFLRSATSTFKNGEDTYASEGDLPTLVVVRGRLLHCEDTLLPWVPV